ncbi:MAG: hypothetical protein KDB80_18340 [Planctomycetes bacterium]|nr:hypothetical protein [Planctomycetota bacterium]
MRKLKIAAIVLSVLIALLLLFVTAFIYNPTEGSLADVRGIVPRNVDFFLRKTDLANDFAEFPEPLFWGEFANSRAWRQLRSAPMTSEAVDSVGKSLADLRDLTQRIAADSGGWIDLVRDVFGQEVVVAGTLQPPAFERSKFCAYLRVSWRVRFLWGLLGWQSIQSSVVDSGVNLAARPDGTFAIVQGNDTFYLGRRLDCLMVANDDDLLQKSLALADGISGEDAFGDSASYRDGIESRLREWEEKVGYEANAVEMYVRPDQLFALTKFDDGWPNPRHPDDMNERVLASFLNLESWRFLTSSVLFEPGYLTLQAKVELNRNKHTGFQSEFFRAESAPFETWLTPFLAMVPEGVKGRGACAAAAIRVAAADFLAEMYHALEDQALIDDPLRATGKYTGALDLIDKLRPVLLPRIGFVFMRARDLKIEVFEPSPAPHFAWVFWIRRESRAVLDELRDYLTVNRKSLGFTNVTEIKMAGLSQPCREFQNPNIPGTGEIALLIYNDFFILSNSSFLARDMMDARAESKSLLQDAAWPGIQRELPSQINGFVYLNGERLSNVFGDYVRHVNEGSREVDPSWMMSNRDRIEKRVLGASFSQYGSPAQIPQSEQDAFEQAVDREMNAEWLRQRAEYTAGDRERYEELRILAGMVDAAYVQVELDPQFIQLTSGVSLFPFQ